MSMNSFAPFLIQPGTSTFLVKNITGTPSNPNPPKLVNIFNYPILPNGGTRDLMKIEGVGESEIRVSLLKGEINHKLRAQEITILSSDVDLLQFNNNQSEFLYRHGIDTGVQMGSPQMFYTYKQDVELIGTVDDINTVFTIPSGKFTYDSNHNIIVYKNGVKQFYLDDFFIAESGGPGTGYDTVILTIPPTITPLPPDVITADYYVLNR